MSAIHPDTRRRARTLRAEMTVPERRLWRELRELNRVLGLHFRRQAPIGPFIADFADLGRRLMIELDGSGHGGAKDARRDAWLKGRGFTVLRFWNAEVFENSDGVMQLILDAVGGDLGEGSPPPRPSPARGEGGDGTGEVAASPGP